MNELNPLLNIFSKDIQATHYLITLNDEIGAASQYSELIALLKFANENDVIEIEINNNGGHIDTALQIKNAIHECKAQVITCLNVAAHSAAGVVFLSGHSYKIGKYGSLLIHEGSTGYVGKPSDLRRHSEFQNAQLERVVRDVYEEILTPSEIEAVLNGLELILDDTELMKRLNNRPKPKDEFSAMLNTDLREMFKVKLDEYVGKKLTQANVETISQELADEVVNMLTSEVEE